MKQRLFKLIYSVSLLGVLAACEESPSNGGLEGFRYLGVDGPYHFVAVAPEFVGERTPQLEAGRKICEEKGSLDYCEVYFWKEGEQPGVIKFPIERSGKVVGLYTARDGKTKLERELK